MGVSLSSISRVTGVEVTPKNFNAGNAAMLPQRLAIIGQGNDDAEYSLDKYECEANADDVAKRFGYGSPLHLACRQLFPSSGTVATFPVTIYPVKKSSTMAAATGTITVTGTATKNGSGKIYIGGIEAEFSAEKGAAALDVMQQMVGTINGILEMPVTAEVKQTEATPSVPYIELKAKWSGALGNDITVIADYTAEGLDVAVSAHLEEGAGVPNISDALAKINEIWETMVLNTLGYKDEGLLDKYQVFGEGRWDVLCKKPCLVATGCTDNYATRTAVTELRKTDYINFLVTSVGSPELPFVIAAKAMLNDILTTADKDPASGYKGLLSGLKAGSDDAQENYTVRDMSIKKGASTNIKNGSVAELNDIVTMYHPDSEGKYPYRRYVADAIKVMNIVYNLRLIIESDEKKGAPLVPDSSVTTNPNAIQPKMVKGEMAVLADSLALAAILADAKFTKERLVVKISSENPKRLDCTFPCKISGNVEVISCDLFYGFYLE